MRVSLCIGFGVAGVFLIYKIWKQDVERRKNASVVLIDLNDKLSNISDEIGKTLKASPVDWKGFEKHSEEYNRINEQRRTLQHFLNTPFPFSLKE